MFTGEDLKQLLVVLLRNKLLILFVTGAGLFVGLLYSARQPAPEYAYDATAALSVAYGQNLGQIAGNIVILNYSEVAASRLVCDHAAGLLEGEGVTGEQIGRMISIDSGNNSYVLRITARSESPRLAILVVNAVAESFISQVTAVTGSKTIQVLDPARTAEAVARGGNSIRLLAPAVAFIMICGLLVAVELIMGKARSIKQCLTDEGELLAIIPRVRRK